MRIRTIGSLFAKQKVGKSLNSKIYSGYDSVYYYPPIKDIWKYLRGKYSSCYYITSDDKYGWCFHDRYTSIKGRKKFMRILVYVFYYLRLRTWIK